jgi:hypothetical protein
MWVQKGDDCRSAPQRARCVRCARHGEASLFVLSFGRRACWVPKVGRGAKYRGQALGGTEQINILPDEPGIDSRGRSQPIATRLGRETLRLGRAADNNGGWALVVGRRPRRPLASEFYQYSPAPDLRRGGSLGPLLRCGNGEGLRVHD